MGKPSQLFSVGLTVDFAILGVFHHVAVLHELSCFFIDKADVPPERWKDVTYGRVVVSYRPEKGDPYRTRLTVDGNLIIYPSDCGTPTVELLTFKLSINSVISIPGAKFMTINIKDFFPQHADGDIRAHEAEAQRPNQGFHKEI